MTSAEQIRAHEKRVKALADTLEEICNDAAARNLKPNGAEMEAALIERHPEVAGDHELLVFAFKAASHRFWEIDQWPELHLRSQGWSHKPGALAWAEMEKNKRTAST